MDLYILYKNGTGNHEFQIITIQDMKVSPSFRQQWEQANPAKQLIAVFDANDEKISKLEQERRLFNYNCRKYGFSLSDYRAKVKLNDGAIGELVGFKSQNRTYPCIIELQSGKRCKAAPVYVKARMAMTP